MDLLFILKSATVVSLFFIIYKALLKNENFFKLNRIYLFSGLLVSFIIPLIQITNIEWIEAPKVEPVTTVIPSIINNHTEIPAAEIPQENFSIDWLQILVIIYVIGVLLFFIRFLTQLFSVRQQIRNGVTTQENGIQFINNSKNKSPFSFFNYIIYNKEQFSHQELKTILTHEKAHCKQWHSIDIVIAQLTSIVLWFNPLVWKYQKAIQDNLEFLADQSTVNQNINTKDYQYLLVKTIVSSAQYCAITHHFNQSLIKKRIQMLNKKTDSKRYWKTLIILPALVVFIYSCNQKTDIKIKEIAENTIQLENEKFNNEEYYKTVLKGSGYQEFSLPIRNGEKLNIASEFGIRLHPLLKTKKMHNGIDLKAKSGTPVYATIEGEVIFADKEGGYGNLVKIKNNNGYETRFAQLQDINVTVGEKVSIKDQIGTVGSTGMATGPHLHYELLYNDEYINPKASLGLLPKYHIYPNHSNKTIEATVELFNHNNNYTNIKIDNIKRSSDGNIIHLSFHSQFNGKNDFTHNITLDPKVRVIRPFEFYYDELQKGIQFKSESGLDLIITKDGAKTTLESIRKANNKGKLKSKSFDYDKQRYVIKGGSWKDVEEFLNNSKNLGDNYINIINDKVYTKQDLEKMNVDRIYTEESIEHLSPKEAVEKYGEIAKDGALIYHGKSRLVKKTELKTNTN